MLLPCDSVLNKIWVVGRVKTPNYELWGALAVDVRVNISGEGWTVNKLQFSYFANTAARYCMAYGPGLLANVCILNPTPSPMGCCIVMLACSYR